MTRRYRATKLRTTFQASLGTKVPEKREQLAFLADRIEIKGLPCPPIAGVEGHPIYKQAKAYPYEDISAYFRMVDEEVRQRGERAARSFAGCEPGACVPHASCDWCAVCGKSGKVIVWEKRLAAQSNMRDVEKAFAELGRIVGEHAGDIRLSAEYPDPEESLRKLAAACSYRFATITETAPVKADRMSPFTEGATKWARGLRAIEAIGFDDRWDAEAKKKLGGG